MSVCILRRHVRARAPPRLFVWRKQHLISDIFSVPCACVTATKPSHKIPHINLLRVGCTIDPPAKKHEKSIHDAPSDNRRQHLDTGTAGASKPTTQALPQTTKKKEKREREREDNRRCLGLFRLLRAYAAWRASCVCRTRRVSRRRAGEPGVCKRSAGLENVGQKLYVCVSSLPSAFRSLSLRHVLSLSLCKCGCVFFFGVATPRCRRSRLCALSVHIFVRQKRIRLESQSSAEPRVVTCCAAV